MQRITILGLTTALCLSFAAHAAEPVELFNGKNLNGWTCFLMDDAVKDGTKAHPTAQLEDVWSVEDGILVCKGEPMGYLATKKKYEDFEMVVEWRWAPGTKPGNSGVLLRVTGKKRMLPKCVEAQLQSGNAGFIWAFHGFNVEGDEARTKTIEAHEKGGAMKGVAKIEAAENEPGEWNKYVIRLKDDSLRLTVNGKLVNEASGLDEVAGRVALQSEGGEIHFRTVKLWPID